LFSSKYDCYLLSFNPRTGICFDPFSAMVQELTRARYCCSLFPQTNVGYEYVTRFGKIRLNTAQVIFQLSHVVVNEVYFLSKKK